MKAINIQVKVGYIIFVLFVMNSCGQSGDSVKKGQAKQAVTINSIKIPEAVLDSFKNEFPVLKYENWQGYPAIDYQNYWYEYNPDFYTNEYPGNYVVEFVKDSISYKVRYGKNGNKIAVHRALKSDLPKTVSMALNNSKYKGWAMGMDKEEIFRDKDSDKLKIYKIEVTKGNEKHTLYFQADGKLIGDKRVFK